MRLTLFEALTVDSVRSKLLPKLLYIRSAASPILSPFMSLLLGVVVLFIRAAAAFSDYPLSLVLLPPLCDTCDRAESTAEGESGRESWEDVRPSGRSKAGQTPERPEDDISTRRTCPWVVVVHQSLLCIAHSLASKHDEFGGNSEGAEADVWFL